MEARVSMRNLTRLAIISLVCLVALATQMWVSEAQRIGGGVVRGQIWGYTWLDEATPLVWARISAFVNGSLVNEVSSGANGSYTMYLPRGSVTITVEYAGFIRQSKVVHVSDGGTTTLNWYLERSGLPIPEFTKYGLILVTAATVALYQILLRRRTKAALLRE